MSTREGKASRLLHNLGKFAYNMNVLVFFLDSSEARDEDPEGELARHTLESDFKNFRNCYPRIHSCADSVKFTFRS